MKVKGITPQQLKEVMQETQNFYPCLTFNRQPEKIGNCLHFTIQSKTGEVGSSYKHGRKSKSASWQAHRDFFTVLFNTVPDAKIVTELATYDGKQDFKDKFPSTFNTNVGNGMVLGVCQYLAADKVPVLK
jgi:hypothetical protein